MTAATTEDRARLVASTLRSFAGALGEIGGLVGPVIEQLSELADVVDPEIDDPPPPHRAQDAEERGEGICRTCLLPIWSDRIERGGDSLVCFKAIDYRHVPLTGREAAIYDHAIRAGMAYVQIGGRS